MKRFTFLLVISMFLSVGLMSQDKNEINPKSLLTRAISTNVSPTYPNALYDLLGNYSVDSLLGTVYSYGVCWTGTEYITSRFSVNMFNRISSAWTRIDSFAASGASTGYFRDLAYAKGLIWGSPVEGTIYGINPTTGVMVKSITCSGAVQIRAITWDPVRNGFWCGTNNFTGPFICYDTNGVAIPGATIAGPASGCYGIAYDDDPAGPFLWVSTDQTPASPTGIAILKFNATTLTQIGTAINITVPLTVPGTGSTALASGGSEVVKTLIPGKRTLVGLVQGDPDRVYVVDLGTTDAGPLLPFNLQTPVAGTTITSIAGSSTPVTITWDTSRAAATYKWIFGSALPTRLLTISSPTNMLTKTLGEIDVILAGLGLNQGDSISGSWDVWAFRNNDPQNDSLKSANGPRTIKFKRLKPALSAFSLLAPVTGAILVGVPGSTTPYTISWTQSGAGASYKWLYKTGTSYTDPPTIKLPLSTSNDTTLTITAGQLDVLLAGLGLNPGDSIKGYWRVRAYSGVTDSLNSTAPDRQITLKRAMFSSSVFSGSIATGDPVFIRPNGNSGNSATPPTVLSSYSVPYKTTMFTVSNSGQYYIYMGASYDCFIALYQGTFNPANGLTNCIGANDDTSGTWMPEFPTGSLNRSAISYITLNSGTNYIVVSTAYNSGRGNWKDSIYGPGIINIITNVEQVGNIVPTEYKLSQNYPNPFNPTTKINFAIPKQGFVNLKIFDVLGREVRTLVSEVKTPGNYIVDFNAEELSSGVYFYKLSAGSFTDVKRMMLIK